MDQPWILKLRALKESLNGVRKNTATQQKSNGFNYSNRWYISSGSSDKRDAGKPNVV